jgi:hypothetical protein
MIRNTSWRALLLMSAFFLLTTTRISLTQQPQHPDRLIEQKFAPKEPVKITSVKNNRAKVKIGTKFQDDEEWLKVFHVGTH